MSDKVQVTIEIDADRLTAFQRAVPASWNGHILNISMPGGTAIPALSIEQARLRMVQEATPLQLQVLDALHGLPGHEGTRAQIATAASISERQAEGVLGSLGAKLNSRVPGQRKRAIHLWVEETTTLQGEKLYRMRPEFISDCGRW